MSELCAIMLRMFFFSSRDDFAQLLPFVCVNVVFHMTKVCIVSSFQHWKVLSRKESHPRRLTVRIFSPQYFHFKFCSLFLFLINSLLDIWHWRHSRNPHYSCVPSVIPLSSFEFLVFPVLPVLFPHPFALPPHENLSQQYLFSFYVEYVCDCAV